MHENWEVSSAPWSDDQGRSAKAMNRAADMHALEKSDGAVVPVKQPNKEGRPSAEAVEGRAQTKENIGQSDMHPTQNGKRMSQGLDGVRRTAREKKQERFTALFHHPVYLTTIFSFTIIHLRTFGCRVSRSRDRLSHFTCGAGDLCFPIYRQKP
jgi:hypothetical protein